jgi:hypothetical protein
LYFIFAGSFSAPSRSIDKTLHFDLDVDKNLNYAQLSLANLTVQVSMPTTFTVSARKPSVYSSAFGTANFVGGVHSSANLTLDRMMLRNNVKRNSNTWRFKASHKRALSIRIPEPVLESVELSSGSCSSFGYGACSMADTALSGPMTTAVARIMHEQIDLQLYNFLGRGNDFLFILYFAVHII